MAKVENVTPKFEQANPYDPLSTGNRVLIRTVTHYHVGEIIDIKTEYGVPRAILENASWVAETNRFGQTLAEGTLKEAEPMPGMVAVLLGSGVDVAFWNHPLPTEAI